MIKSISTKKLKHAVESNDYSAFPVKNQKKIELVINTLESAVHLNDCKLYGARFHVHKSSKDKNEKLYSLDVGAKERILFNFISGHAENLTYTDPH